jgi:hypothetical protein
VLTRVAPWRDVCTGSSMGALSRTLLVLAVAAWGCLPADPPDFSRDAGTVKGSARTGSKGAKGRVLSPAASGRRPRGPTDAGPQLLSGPVLSDPFRDDFDRADLGQDWYATSSVWRITDGRLCGQGARNHPVWLKKRLPVNARIEFDATSASPDGDIKVEAWGDGRSYASGTTYDDATSYLFILGGWKNRFNVLARLNEHAQDRQQVRLLPDSEDPRTRQIVEGRSYHVEIERADGQTVTFTVDETPIHELSDPAPLKGAGHEHFGFNNWDVPVCFDALQVTPLEG